MRRVTLWAAALLLLASPALAWGQAPQTGSDYVNRGNTRFQAGDIDGAIADYTEAIELNASDSIAYYNRGIARGRQGDHTRAIADYTRAIQIGGHYANAYYNRGVAKHAKGDFEGAISDWSRTIELDPKHLPAHFNRGMAKLEKVEVEGAIADFTRAIELDATLSDALRREHVHLDGAPADLRAFPQWFTWSPMADTVRAALADQSRTVPQLSKSKLTESAA